MKIKKSFLNKFTSLFKNIFNPTEDRLVEVALNKICFYSSITRYQFFIRAYKFALYKQEAFEKEFIEITSLPSNANKNKQLKEFILKVNKETNKMPYTVDTIKY